MTGLEVSPHPCRYGGFSLGAGGSQALPSALEVDEAVLELRALFNITPVRPGLGSPRSAPASRRWEGSGLCLLLTPCSRTQGSPSDRLLRNLSRFIEGLDARRNIKVRTAPGWGVPQGREPGGSRDVTPVSPSMAGAA